MNLFLRFSVMVMVMVMALVAEVHGQEHSMGDISGSYSITGKDECMFDDGEKIKRLHTTITVNIKYDKTAVSEVNFYDIYDIYENATWQGYLYVGPNKDSKKWYYMFFSLDSSGEIGYLLKKKRKFKAVHSAITDGWLGTREYSCKVTRVWIKQ